MADVPNHCLSAFYSYCLDCTSHTLYMKNPVVGPVQATYASDGTQFQPTLYTLAPAGPLYGSFNTTLLVLLAASRQQVCCWRKSIRWWHKGSRSTLHSSVSDSLTGGVLGLYLVLDWLQRDSAAVDTFNPQHVLFCLLAWQFCKKSSPLTRVLIHL